LSAKQYSPLELLIKLIFLVTDETLKLSLSSKAVEFEATAVEQEFGTGIGGI